MSYLQYSFSYNIFQWKEKTTQYRRHNVIIKSQTVRISTLNQPLMATSTLFDGLGTQYELYTQAKCHNNNNTFKSIIIALFTNGLNSITQNRTIRYI